MWLFYRPPFPSDWKSVTDVVVDDEARYLAEAELYVLSPQMCDVGDRGRTDPHL